MKSWKWLAVILAVALACAAGCAPSQPALSSEPAAQQSAGAQPGDEKPGADEGGDEDGLLIGALMPTVQGDAFAAMHDAFYSAAQELGVQAVVYSADHNLDTQISQMQDLITMGADALIICTVDADGIVPLVDEARGKGIPVLAVDRTINGEIDYSIQTDNVLAGRLGAEYFGKIADGKEGEVLLLIADPSVSGLNERQQGFKQYIESDTKLEIVSEPLIETSTELAYNAVMDAFSANPGIRYIFASSDVYVPAIQSALKELNMQHTDPNDEKHVYIASVDGEKACLEGLEQGITDCVVCQMFVEITEKSVKTAVDMINGIEPETKAELYPAIAVTRENISEFGPGDLWGLR